MIPYSEGICCKCQATAVIVKRLPSGHLCHKHNQERLSEGKEKKVTVIRKESKKRGKENREYEKLKKQYLALNPVCEGNVIDNGVLICSYKATDLHHMAGRTGKLLTNTMYFMALCRNCHTWAELNPEKAKAKGLSVSRLESKQEIIPLNE